MSANQQNTRSGVRVEDSDIGISIKEVLKELNGKDIPYISGRNQYVG